MNTSIEHPISQELLTQAMSYEAYRTLTKELLIKNRTTGPNQDPWLIDYTKLNDKRMDRLDKTILLNNDLKVAIQSLKKEMYWLVITEAWCGDAAQNIPLLAKLAKENPNITLKLILRDEYPEIMDLYLTNGGRSIPKLIALDKNSLKELGKWGPRPNQVQQMVMKAKEEQVDKDTFIKEVHNWYSKDKTQSMQAEMVDFLHELNQA